MGNKCKQTDVKLTNVECSNYASLIILSIVWQNNCIFKNHGKKLQTDVKLTNVECSN